MNAVIFHGTSGSPDSFWIPYIREHLESLGYEVQVPQLPQADNPHLDAWLPYALERCRFDSGTLIIAHSAGCPLALAVMQKVRVRKAILVAGFARELEGLEQSRQMLTDFSWNQIRSNVKEIIFINSDNDPWHCDDKQGRYMFDKLGGTLIIRHGEGHMGSEKFGQPYKEFPFLKRLI